MLLKTLIIVLCLEASLRSHGLNDSATGIESPGVSSGLNTTLGHGTPVARPTVAAATPRQLPATATNTQAKLPPTGSPVRIDRATPIAVGRPADSQSGSDRHQPSFVESLAEIASGTESTSSSHREFENSIRQMAPTGRLSNDSITRFATDLRKILPGVKSFKPELQKQLTSTTRLVLSPETSIDQIETTVATLRRQLIAAGLSPLYAQVLAGDLHLLAAEVRLPRG